MRRRAALVLAAAALLPAAAPAQPRECNPCAPGRFDSIEISGSASVRFTQGSTEAVRVEGDEEARKAVEFEVRDGVLQIRPDGGWKFWSAQRVQIGISARELKRVTISGAADFVAPLPVRSGRLDINISGSGLARFDKLQAESLRFQVSGAGDGQVAGQVNELQIMVSGRGEFRGENLLSQRAKVAVSGIGEVRVWATQWLGVDVSGVGTVDYWGAPQLERRSSGIAKINERGPKPLPP
jgi:hypothetical protein